MLSQDVVQSAALLENTTVHTLLVRIATDMRFSNYDEVASSWWRRHRTGDKLPPRVLETCQHLIEQNQAYTS